MRLKCPIPHAATGMDEGHEFEMHEPDSICFILQEALSALCDKNKPKTLHSLVAIYLLNQMSAKEGIRKHGAKTDEALHEEFL